MGYTNVAPINLAGCIYHGRRIPPVWITTCITVWRLTLNNTNWTNTVAPYLGDLVVQRGYPIL